MVLASNLRKGELVAVGRTRWCSAEHQVVDGPRRRGKRQGAGARGGAPRGWTAKRGPGAAVLPGAPRRGSRPDLGTRERLGRHRASTGDLLGRPASGRKPTRRVRLDPLEVGFRFSPRELV
jgi:hypothetical protein